MTRRLVKPAILQDCNIADERNKNCTEATDHVSSHMDVVPLPQIEADILAAVRHFGIMQQHSWQAF